MKGKRMFKKLCLIIFVILFSSFMEAQDKGAQMRLLSPAFKDKSEIPTKFTCDGEDISPPLMIKNVPKEAKSLALIMDDPDAPMGTFVHWVVYDIDPSTTLIEENQPHTPTILNGAKQGKNDFPKIGYGGPCPPNGRHRYFFKLYALDAKLDLDPGLTKEELLKHIQRHVIAQSVFMGTYERKKRKFNLFSFFF